MRRPKYLHMNGTIGFVAPSFGCNIEPYKTCFSKALEKFEAAGYALKIGPNSYEGKGVGISNTPYLCAKELQEAYTDKDIDIIMSCGGGELMCEILDYIDFDLIKKSEPKWYLGYSDNTNFIYPLTTICDTMALYGPCAPAFGSDYHTSHTDTLEILTGQRSFVSNYDMWEIESLKTEENPLVSYNLTEKNCMKAFKHKENVSESANINDYNDFFEETGELHMEGRLVGGCLDCLLNLVGTKYDKTTEFLEKYKEDGFIWFLESCDLNVFSIRRGMWELKNADWFKYIKGVIIGRPYHFDEPMFGLDKFNAFLNQLENLGVSVIMDCDFGHLPPAMPIVSGACADILYKDNKMTINYKF